ncbi:hypothetical protein E2C01_092983 [Portunus trituberculatus]|uniref:Uncharacterized protein n=1 Tax=Portunus trituberculatus TaxID=210409 RepID=A0A5B7JS53_PORTR|nr:hypothetical protein [Portunus trituberculatus]
MALKGLRSSRKRPTGRRHLETSCNVVISYHYCCKTRESAKSCGVPVSPQHTPMICLPSNK